MRLLINTATALKGGSVQVATSFLQECKRHTNHEFGVILGPGLSELSKIRDFPKNFRFLTLNYRPAQRVFSMRGASRDFKKFEAEFKPDVVFTTSGPSYWRPKAPHLMGFNLAHHLYPDSPYFVELLTPLTRLRWRAKSALIHYFVKNDADAWVVQTADVNRRLRRWLPSKDVYTVSNTVGKAFLSAQTEDNNGTAKSVDRSSSFSLLILSGYYPHKNLEIVNDVLDQLRQRGVVDVRFTMTLPDKEYKRVVSMDNQKWVDNIGPQLPEDCPSIYKQSDALFLPTLLECFSANYAEAMFMGVPIITTDLGFAHTICSRAAAYFTPMDASSAVGQIIKVKNDAEMRRTLIENGHRELRKFGTPRERADKYLEICELLCAS